MINMLKKHFYNYQLFFEIMIIIMIFMTTLSVILTTVTINLSSESYIDSYVDSNKLILERTTIEYENLHSSINTMLTSFKDSQEVKLFLTTTEKESVTENYTIFYQFGAFMDRQSYQFYKNIPYQLVLVGINGQTFYNNNAIQNISTTELLAKPFVTSLKADPSLIASIPADYELIKRSINGPTILSGTAITDEKNHTIIGYAFIELTETDFSSIYDKLISPDVNTILVANQYNEVLSSNKKELLQTKKKKYTALNHIRQSLTIPSFNFSITSEIQLDSLKKEMAIWPKVITLMLLIFLLLIILLFFYLKKILSPLYKLIETTPKIVEGDFNQKILVSGTYEIKKLISSYNYLQDGLNIYMQQLLYTEKEKRKAEIKSLQLHIKPHFIYNTLTSIKFLIFENRNTEALTALNAFINLLEQTIYNKNELIPLKQELLILKDFSTILNTRYGNRIEFMSIIPDELQEFKLPKLLLQPFVENAFIHAFPNEIAGSICVTAKQTDEWFRIDIMDTGIGFNQDTTSQTEKQNFSGIGIHNVQERISLFYNNQATLTIESVKNQGTIVTIKIPIV
ncbi:MULTISPECIES: sensor histidine kinase [Carnobacterium]|nr:histidine kinase [Carnobacterium maltaromaticum]MDT1945936.1 histidine kinase [Carnobacterium maltaromaticum]MDT2000440.1 histidine kinase [Carnobacterium maltaromaticum]TFJ30247.1 sensor histidine kinase [Carnobacterium maltaromaticum]TFJ33707.1 sensor histidine kinase [Carnobacterium maltaromaticum]TFJ37524.1 sensor histidine kinase [Carnobacterium maltaromaticum]